MLLKVSPCQHSLSTAWYKP